MVENGDLVSAARHVGYVMMLRPKYEQAHADLRQILLSLAREPDGLQRLREIAANAPDSPRMLDELAWLLATYPDSKSRDGAEAVRLAERACDLTERRILALLDTLAAAYAETGDFPRAISAAEEALNRADCWRKISSLSVSRSQRSEKSRNAPLGKRASALGKTNCLGAVARIRVGIGRKQPREFVQHSR